MALYAMFRAEGPQEWPLGQATLAIGITGMTIGLWMMTKSIKASQQQLTNLILPEAASDIVLLQTNDKQWAQKVLSHCTSNPSLDSWLINNANKTITDIE